MTARILVVDDIPANVKLLEARLMAEYFEVLTAADGMTALSICDQTPVDLILLDIMMPGEDGLSLCRHLVESRGLPTILLTAKGEAMDRIIGLEIGADDYVTKPFEPRELVARIRSVLRRAERPAAVADEELLYRFEDWQLDPLKRRLTDPDNALVPLSTAEFRMLRAFCDHPRQVLDRDRLLDMVQGREAQLFDRAVDNQISRLRRKIETDSRNPHFIQTVRGGGYRFGAEVTRVARDDSA